MKIQYDNSKRDATLLHRGLDFARANEVFSQEWLVKKDERFDYDEQRFSATECWMADGLYWFGLRAARPAASFP
jgi:uncharacterized DUF497 family protein